MISFVPFPGARIVSGLVDAMLALPSFLVALSFTFIYGTAGVLGSISGGFLTSPWAVVLAEITFYTPFVMRPLLGAMGADPARPAGCRGESRRRPLARTAHRRAP